MAKRGIPIRTCIGCRISQPKSQLIRIVVNKKGEIAVDFKGKMPGRGAYLCSNSEECLKKAVEKKAFSLAFKRKVKIDYEKARKIISQASAANRGGSGSY